MSDRLRGQSCRGWNLHSRRSRPFLFNGNKNSGFSSILSYTKYIIVERGRCFNDDVERNLHWHIDEKYDLLDDAAIPINFFLSFALRGNYCRFTKDNSPQDTNGWWEFSDSQVFVIIFVDLSKVSSILYSIKFYSTPEPNESQLNGRNYNVNWFAWIIVRKYPYELLYK